MPTKKFNPIIEIFARIWALWGLLSFAITFLIIIIPARFADLFKNYAEGQRYFLRVARVWMRVWLFLVGCPVKIRGKENFQRGEAYVVTFNHNALLDVPLSAPFVPGANKTIAKSSFAKVPIFGWFYSRGSILVNRKDEKSRLKSFDQMKQVLQQGMHMCIYPEGTRNRTDQPLKSFYDGAFKLAADSGKKILPCIITGTKKAMPIHKKFFLLPTPLTMNFLEPVSAEGLTATELKEKVYEVMMNAYLALDSAGK
jgi:1-acyl-sn-glycerol-3-phosphate acyltransferase